jgi:hypothetical protein
MGQTFSYANCYYVLAAILLALMPRYCLMGFVWLPDILSDGAFYFAGGN